MRHLDKGSRPSNNVFKVGESQTASTEPIRNPTLTYDIDLTEKEVKEKLDKNIPITLLS
jgi:hypothetical protein